MFWAPCKRTEHCWPTTPNIVGCYMLRPFVRPVGCCCAKFETGQTFQSTTPNISFVPWSPKRSATMLDPFAQLFQHCWGHARSLRMVYKDMSYILPTMHCRSQHCWEFFNPFARQLPTRTQQLPTLLAQQCFASCCVRLHAALVARPHENSKTMEIP